MDRKIVWTVVGTVAVAGALGAVGGLAFIYSGVYPIAASEPHLRIVRWVMTTTMERSVQRAAAGIRTPRLDDPMLVRRGFELYRNECQVCHGAPGIAAQQIGRGINPDPPRLDKAGSKWTEAEIAWIIKNGMKMSGMPAMGAGHSAADIWAMTAFVRRLAWLSPREYAQMEAAVSGDAAAARSVPWIEQGDLGFGLLRRNGNVQRGKRSIAAFGCGACHMIPGVPGASGLAGPPLEDFAARHYIAGELVNTPMNLVAWLVDPQAIEPGTVMPRVGLTAAQALDVAAYLYTLGKVTRMEPPFPPKP